MSASWINVSTQILNVKVLGAIFKYDLNLIFSLVFVFLSIVNYDELKQITGW